jgi:hypothetical protein
MKADTDEKGQIAQDDPDIDLDSSTPEAPQILSRVHVNLILGI